MTPCELVEVWVGHIYTKKGMRLRDYVDETRGSKTIRHRRRCRSDDGRRSARGRTDDNGRANLWFGC